MEQNTQEVRDFMDYLLRNFRRGQVGLPHLTDTSVLSVDPFMARQALSVLINSVGPQLQSIVQKIRPGDQPSLKPNQKGLEEL